nr:tail tube B [uncultured Mediterranean phage uvMED]BAR25547.1 tail tube B [uncultured Mediterranean phage uvMED]
MASITQTIPNLLGGVSQQPDPIKLAGQLREAKNVYLDPTFGCRKRPSTKYINELANDIPANSKWVPIFRDSNERYIACLYKNNSDNVQIRVWDVINGEEKTVNTYGTGTNYLNCDSLDSIHHLTISDYTLFSNSEQIVTMGSSVEDTSKQQAIVVINTVSYNTTYAIDLAKDGDASGQIRVYRATGIEVIPSTYELDDAGVCSDVDAQNFIESSGSKTGLSFRLTNQCAAYLQTDTTSVPSVLRSSNNIEQIFTTTYDAGGGKTLTFRYFSHSFSGTSVTILGSTGFWSKNESFTVNGVNFRVDDVTVSSTDRYISRYSTDVVLKNGGQGWRVGDEVTVNMSGRDFIIRVTAEDFIYTFSSDGTASYTTSSVDSGNSLDIGAITANLVNAVNGITGYTADATGNVIRVTRNDDRDFNIQARGGPTFKAMQVLKNSAQDISQLPNQCFPDFELLVANTQESDQDNYYVKFVPDAAGIAGTGTWVETVKKGIPIALSSSTMPHALIREADGTFSFRAVGIDTAFDGWAGREVGDEYTNPEPSFVGRTISNMFFYNNRLGFLSEDAIIMSQSGDFFNFFVTSSVSVSDVDPIDVTASSTKPAMLQAAVGTTGGLVCFAENSQFLLSSDDFIFSTNTVKLSEISQYYYKSKVEPILSGVSIAFTSEAESYSKIMEMAVDSLSSRPATADITRTIPEYIPTNLEWAETSPTNSLMMFGDKSNTIYVFKFYNEGEERKIAGWSKWEMADSVYLGAYEADTGYFVEYNGSSYILSSSELLDPNNSPLVTSFSQFTPRLDRYVTQDTITPVDNGDGTSTITLPNGLYSPESTLVLIPTSGVESLSISEPTVVNNQITVDSDLVSANYTIGLKYVAEIQLPTIHVTQNNRADRVNVPIVHFMDIDLYYSGRYKIKVDRTGYDSFETTVGNINSDIYIEDTIPVKEISTETIPLFAKGNEIFVTICAEDPFPSSITSYSWKGIYNNRGISII